MKKLIFYLSLLVLINFQNIYAMENEASIENKAPQAKLSEKAQKVSQFLKNLGIDTNNEKAGAAIKYFNNPKAGIPILIKKENLSSSPLSQFQKLYKYLERKLFCYPLQKLKCQWDLEKLRKNNCYYKGKRESYEIDEYEMPHEIDEYATKIALSFREKIQIPPEIDIPIFKRNFCYTNFLNGGCFDTASMEVPQNSDEIYCQIKTNAWLNKELPLDVVKFALAHEYAHLERGFWTPYRKLLLTKGILGAGGAGLILCGLLFKDSNLHTKLIGCGLGALKGIITGNLFANYFHQQEEIACDLQAVESTRPSNKTLEIFFSLRPKSLSPVQSDDNWSIQELKITCEKPSEYSTLKQKLFATHPSDAERLRYCKDYAEQLQKAASDPNSYTYFCGYKIRKNDSHIEQSNNASHSNTLFGYKIRRDNL